MAIQDKIFLAGTTQGSAGASEVISVGFGSNNVYAATKFAVQCDFAATPTSSCTLALMGTLDSEYSAGSRFVTLGAQTVTAGDLTGFSFRLDIDGKAAKHVKAHMAAMTGTVSFVVKCIATR